MAIIIDDIDVSGCKYFDSDSYRLHVMPCYLQELPNGCKGNDCYYKQLKRKDSTVKKIFSESYQKWMYYIANGINNASSTTIGHLLEDLCIITKLLAAECGIKDRTLDYYVRDHIVREPLTSNFLVGKYNQCIYITEKAYRLTPFQIIEDAINVRGITFFIVDKEVDNGK